MSDIINRLKSKNIVLPTPMLPAANYLPYVISENTIFIAGQIPIKNGKLPYLGKLGKSISDEEGKEAAKLCAINILAVLNSVLDKNLERINKCIKLGVFINAVEDYKNHPEIANGASDLIVDILGKNGKHARFAVGASSLPRNVPVEVDGIFEIS